MNQIQPQYLTIAGLIFTILGLCLTGLGTMLNWKKTKSDLSFLTKSNEELEKESKNLKKINESQSQKLAELKISSENLNMMNESQSQKLKILENNNIELIQANNLQLKDLSKLREANNLLSNELVSSTRELTNQITGGEAYAILSLAVNMVNKKVKVSALVNPEDKYNMNDFKVRIYKASTPDSECLKLFDKIPFKFNQEERMVFGKDHGELPHGSAYVLGSFPLPETKSNYYRVRIFAKNGNYNMNAFVNFVDGKWKTNTSIFERDTDKFMKSFPLN